MRVLLLGGYGNFGSLIAGQLARDADLEIVIAGRDGNTARRLADGLQTQAGARLHATSFDIGAPDLATQLAALTPDLVIHTCGPFQGRDYRVANAALDTGAHYIDLADARDFVVGIGTLDAKARQCGRLVVAGASTVPGLSAAVIDHYLAEFSQLTEIDIGVSPGNHTRRGAATIAAILSYVGQPFQMWKNGQWRKAFGWQDLYRRVYPDPVGKRWLSNCDVPDLSLFPARYPGLATQRFSAGLELGFLHLGLWLLSWPVRWHILPRLDCWTPTLKRISELFASRGSDVGAMHVRLLGIGTDGRPLTLTWTVVAGSGHGPQIPAAAAVVLASMIASGRLTQRGATPCLDLFTLDDYLATLADFDIRTHVQRDRGRFTT